ncbi:amidohydrolase family protein [Pseudomonas sp. dw_358]|uniref:amidohydrolase family protein n=1 Tax=Pseudomonas sp. dw_358 TaxID=2720083 RepID=UPI001BD21E1D|nr:amidohydrolase family protein [Pseudomonas sp. dw_358]
MSIYDEPKIDCHNHLFDPVRFPYLADTVYAPSGQEVATLEQFKRVLDAYGVQHALLVQPTSGYRADNRLLLNALAHDSQRFKGVAVVDHAIGIDALAALKAQGVVGIAFNPALEGVSVLDDAAPLFGRLAELHLFAQIQVQGDQLMDLLWLIDSTSPRLLIDHCGRPDVRKGLAQPGFQALLQLADSGRACVKISGMQKYASINHLDEQAGDYVRALLEAFGPEGCIWGSDWPFIREQARVDYGPLLKLAERLMPDPAVRRQVMWETPRRLFGFSG